MKIVLIGPPGAGKGTVSNYLQEKYDVFHLSPGELLRQEISSGTILGQAVKKYLDAGELILDLVVYTIHRGCAGTYDGDTANLARRAVLVDRWWPWWPWWRRGQRRRAVVAWWPVHERPLR